MAPILKASFIETRGYYPDEIESRDEVGTTMDVREGNRGGGTDQAGLLCVEDSDGNG